MSVTVVSHPLVSHALTILRDRLTGSADFRRAAEQAATAVILECARSLPTRSVNIETPLEPMSSETVETPIVVVPILRAGLALLDPAVKLLPNVSVGYFGMERDENTALARTYYKKLPPIAGNVVLVMDPMLATGGSATYALQQIMEEQPLRVSLVCIVAAPEGIAKVTGEFPDVDIYCGAIDRELDHRKYILPGLGDFGDRMFGTF